MSARASSFFHSRMHPAHCIYTIKLLYHHHHSIQSTNCLCFCLKDIPKDSICYCCYCYYYYLFIWRVGNVLPSQIVKFLKKKQKYRLKFITKWSKQFLFGQCNTATKKNRIKIDSVAIDLRYRKHCQIFAEIENWATLFSLPPTLPIVHSIKQWNSVLNIWAIMLSCSLAFVKFVIVTIFSGEKWQHQRLVEN